jgi:hypothetical protein
MPETNTGCGKQFGMEDRFYYKFRGQSWAYYSTPWNMKPTPSLCCGVTEYNTILALRCIDCAVKFGIHW